MKRRVYVFSLYERIWHWGQAALICLLLITGFEIHAPEAPAIFGFETAVRLHGALGWILIANAFLALFYHIVTGAIRQFIPEPREFLTLGAKLLAYYLRGIFRGARNPFERSPGRKLNPLQQLTYLALLNVLLPFQIATGVLIWGAEAFPRLREALGGLRVIAPLHVLGAWLFAAFVVLHVYLGTTGRTPLEHFRAMVLGWEEGEETGESPGASADSGKEVSS